jgi:hypothetical protein
VTIKGIHENEEGHRKFEHTIDRTKLDLDGMMNSLLASIQNIRKIDALPGEDTTDQWNGFEYLLFSSGNEIAEGGITQLELNLAFTLYINKELIESVKIIGYGQDRILKINQKDNAIGDINFIQLIVNDSPDGKSGLLLKEYGDLIIAIPVKYQHDRYQLQPINGGAHLFKELPLIGTEDFAIPNIIQHKHFLPTEPRDGIRTKRATEDESEADPVADQNRTALADYTSAFPDFLTILVNGNVDNLHLLAQSGLPVNTESYYGKNWLTNNLQKKLREAILEKKLVSTQAGCPILIKDALFPYCPPEHLHKFYKLLSAVFAERTPNECSYHEWFTIISQERENWPEGILIDVSNLIDKINKETLLKQLQTPDAVNNWLQDLISYLEDSQNERLGIEKAIYPNQYGDLSLQNEIFKEINIHDNLKSISKGLGRDLKKELLPKGFKASFVQNFNLKEFLDSMNSTIGNLKIETATDEQVNAIFNICCLFEPSRAPRREAWFDILHRFQPLKVKEKSTIILEEKYNWDSAELWALKKVSHLIQTSVNLQTFTDNYFKDESEALVWLNDFIAFVLRNDENKVALDYAIILTQDQVFKRYTDSIYQEEAPELFTKELKELFKQQEGFSDPGSFLIHRSIYHESLRKSDVSILTTPIDDLFKRKDIEDQVKEGLTYHKLFVALKELTEDDKWAKRFQFFYEKQPILYIKAFGAGSSVGRLLKIKKPIDEIEKLASLSLTAEQLKKLDDAAKMIGNPQSLLDKAQELANTAEEIRWRQEVGGAAESAFLQALKDAHPKFADTQNPDNGRDFVIKIGDKEYSIEIKSAIENKESVKMSLHQGEEASKNKNNYALCVISRPAGTVTNREQFIEKAKFVTNIGYQVGDKITAWRQGLEQIELNENVSVQLDNKTGFVNIRKATWESGDNFSGFIVTLKVYFGL